LKYRGLVVSPVQPSSTGQGNKARVHRMGEILSEFADMDLVHYMYDHRVEDLTKFSPYKTTYNVFPTRSVQAPPINERHLADEWWDIGLEIAIKQLINHFNYDFIIVHYVWLSKALTLVGSDVVKILETHDVLTHRDLIFKKANLKPEFFYCNPEQEAIALARADIILSNQGDDANFFKSLNPDKPIFIIPHLPTKKDLNLESQKDNFYSGPKKRRLGFLGVDNTVNKHALSNFIDALKLEGLNSSYEVHVAGTISNSFASSLDIKSYGYVEDLADFFSRIDIFINPIIHSTGQKIKLMDAISYGIPILSTDNGSEGLPNRVSMHRIVDIKSFMSALRDLANNPEIGLDDLKKMTEDLYISVNKQAEIGIDLLKSAIIRHRKMVYVYVAPNSENFFQNFNIERAIKFAEVFQRLAKFTIFIDKALAPIFIEMNKQAKLSDWHVLEGNKISEKAAMVADKIVCFGNIPSDFKSIAHSAIIDEFSFIQKKGEFNNESDIEQMAFKNLGARSSLQNNPCLPIYFSTIPSIYRNNYSNYGLFLHSTYDDEIFKAIFNCLKKTDLYIKKCYPHQIDGRFITVDYLNILANAFVIIITHDDDDRFLPLISLARLCKIPIISLPNFINSKELSSSKLALALVNLSKLLKKYQSGLGKTASMGAISLNPWKVSSGVWEYIRR